MRSMLSGLLALIPFFSSGPLQAQDFQDMGSFVTLPSTPPPRWEASPPAFPSHKQTAAAQNGRRPFVHKGFAWPPTDR